VIGAVGGSEWTALSPYLFGSDLEANGVRWGVEESEGDVEL
jgi:hypothetical protein